MPPFEAALHGAREVGFTVLSMSLSLIAVFIPILLMGGIVGRLFREFAVTLSVAILVSLVVSLTTTPMMCASCCSRRDERGPRPRRSAWRRARRFDRHASSAFARALACATLRHALARLGAAVAPLMIVILLATIGLNVYLYIDRAQGLLPAAGHRAAWSAHPGRPEHLVPGDAGRSCDASRRS